MNVCWFCDKPFVGPGVLQEYVRLDGQREYAYFCSNRCRNERVRGFNPHTPNKKQMLLAALEAVL